MGVRHGWTVNDEDYGAEGRGFETVRRLLNSDFLFSSNRDMQSEAQLPKTSRHLLTTTCEMFGW